MYQSHPYIKINYVKVRYNEFENKLIEAFATDRGPDMFSIHNTWIRKYQTKNLISPMPSKITMAYPVIKGQIKKEIVPELRTTKSISITELKKRFVDVVHDDVIIKTKDNKTNKISY